MTTKSPFFEKIEFYVECKHCKRTERVVLTRLDYHNWYSGKVNSTDAFPYLTPEQRYLLVNRVCGECHEKNNS